VLKDGGNFVVNLYVLSKQT